MRHLIFLYIYSPPLVSGKMPPGKKPPGKKPSRKLPLGNLPPGNMPPRNHAGGLLLKKLKYFEVMLYIFEFSRV